MQRSGKNLSAGLILIILITIFFFPVAVLQKTFITTGLIQSDLMNQNYPLKAAYGNALKKGKLLLWSSLIGNGYPVFAEGQTGEIYPINLLFFKFLPNLQAYNYSLLVHYFLAAFFTYLFVRKVLKLNQAPGLLAALVYSLSGFFMTHLVHPSMIQVASYIPLNFLLVEKIIRSKQRTKNKEQRTVRYATVLAIVFTLQALAGHHELLYFTVVFLFFYILIRTLQLYRENFFRCLLSVVCCLLIAGLLALGLSAIQILPTLELIKFSTRKTGLSYQEATAYLFPLSHLLTFIKPQNFKFTSVVDYASKFPDAINLWETYGYVGVIPLILAVVAIILWILNTFTKQPKTKSKTPGNWEITATFVFLLLLSLLLAFGRSTPLFKFFWKTVPGIKFFKYPTRFLVFTEFSLAILAALGVEYLCHSLFVIRYSLFALTFLDLFFNNRPINPTVDPQVWFQPPPSALFLQQNLGFNRFHALRTTPFDYSLTEDLQIQFDLKNLLPADFNILYGVRQTDVLAGLLLSRHTQLNHQVPNSILSLNRKDKNTLLPPPTWMRIISLQAGKFLLSPIPFNHPALKLVETIPLTKPLTFNIYLLTKDGQEHEKVSVASIYLYENLQSLPRAFIVPKAFITSEDEKGILKLLSTQDINFKNEVLLEENPPKISNSQFLISNSLSEAEIVEDTDEKVVIKTKSEKPGFLVLADTFYPGWRVFVDGSPTKIYRANFNFRAIVLPKGEHKVEFVYQPRLIKIGAMTSLTTGGVIVLFLVLRKKVRIKISRHLTGLVS